MNEDNQFSLGLQDAGQGFMSVFNNLLQTTAQSFGSVANARLNQWVNSATGGSGPAAAARPATTGTATNYVPILVGAAVLTFLLVRNRK